MSNGIDDAKKKKPWFRWDSQVVGPGGKVLSSKNLMTGDRQTTTNFGVGRRGEPPSGLVGRLRDWYGSRDATPRGAFATGRDHRGAFPVDEIRGAKRTAHSPGELRRKVGEFFGDLDRGPGMPETGGDPKAALRGMDQVLDETIMTPREEWDYWKRGYAKLWKTPEELAVDRGEAPPPGAGGPQGPQQPTGATAPIGTGEGLYKRPADPGDPAAQTAAGGAGTGAATRKRALEMAGVSPYTDVKKAEKALMKKEMFANITRQQAEEWKAQNYNEEDLRQAAFEESQRLEEQGILFTGDYKDIEEAMGSLTDHMLPPPLRHALQKAENSVPIEVIRGTVRTHFDPRTRKEYATLGEALEGRHGKMAEREKAAHELLLEMIKGTNKGKWNHVEAERDPITNEIIREGYFWSNQQPGVTIPESHVERAAADQDVGMLEKRIRSAFKTNRIGDVVAEANEASQEKLFQITKILKAAGLWKEYEEHVAYLRRTGQSGTFEYSAE